MPKKKTTQKPKPYDELTVLQQRFVEYYDGNATQAAEKAGYSNPKQAGSRALSCVDVVFALKTRERRRRTHLIWSREDRQKFWTRVASGQETQDVIVGYNSEGSAIIKSIPPSMNERLKSSELLGRSEADFTDKFGHGLLDEKGNITEIPWRLIDPPKRIDDGDS